MLLACWLSVLVWTLLGFGVRRLEETVAFVTITRRDQLRGSIRDRFVSGHHETRNTVGCDKCDKCDALAL